MILSSLSLAHFRNYQQCNLDFHPKHNLIYGENAQGKTNLLEAVAFLSTMKSHRTQSPKDLMTETKQGIAPITQIVGEVQSRERDFTLDITLNHGAPVLKINQIRKKRRDLEDVFYTVLFCPEDLSLIKSAAIERRRFLDTTISQLRPNYAKALANYQKLYKSKVRILKDWHNNPSLLDTLDDFNLQLASFGADIIHYRAHFLKRLQVITPEILSDFSGGREELALCYHTVSTITDPLAPRDTLFYQVLDHQASHRSAEIASASCLTGPHKDDFSATLNGQAVKKFASQGQTRTLAISLKLAQRELFHQETGEHPVLLLDDVLSELDSKRQDYLLHHAQNGQVFITSCHHEGLCDIATGARFLVDNGVVKGG